MLDLLVFDDSNPHGVVFQANMLIRYLERMARELDDYSDSDLPDVLTRLRAFDLDSLQHLPYGEYTTCTACMALANLLSELDQAAIKVANWLGMRYFTHVGDVSRQTMAL